MGGGLEKIVINDIRKLDPTDPSQTFIATLFILAVQVAVLLTFGNLVFDIQWGDPLPVAIAAAGLVIIAATTGLFLVSLLKNTRHAGIIFGGQYRLRKRFE